MPIDQQPSLSAESLSVGYGTRQIIADLTTLIPPSSFTVILGPNGCGKSTLLRTFARLLKPQGGAVLLNGDDLFTLPSKSVARTIGLLPRPRSRRRESPSSIWCGVAVTRTRAS